MPFLGLSLLLQILCAVHVMKTGRPYYWIFIVMFAPMVGMIAYFIVEILPELTGSRTARTAAAGVGRALNPGRAMREANPSFQSADCHLLYARALEEQGKVAPALHEYQALAPYYPGQEARCRYAMLLEKAGEHRESQRLFREICQSVEMSPRHARRLQREWYDIARRALAA